MGIYEPVGRLLYMDIQIIIIIGMRPKSALIDKLVNENKSLIKQGVYRSEEQTKAEQQIAKMTRLLRQYDAENRFLNKKIEQLVGENYQLKSRKADGKSPRRTVRLGQGTTYT